MSSVLRAQKTNAAKAEAGSKVKRKADDLDAADEAPVPPKKRNKQRVLLLSSRGVTHRMRHLVSDLEALLPHAKKGVWSCSTFFLLGVDFAYRIQVGLEDSVASPSGVGGPQQLQQYTVL